MIRDWRRPSRPRVLDLGAGTGLFASMVHDLLPDASLLLLDGSAKMLDEARVRFASRQSVSFQLGDMTQAGIGNGWNLVVSSLAIHHLEDADKRRLLLRVRQALQPGGMFINVEQVSGPIQLPMIDMHDFGDVTSSRMVRPTYRLELRQNA